MNGWRRTAAAAATGLVLAVVTGVTVRLYPALAAFQPLGIYALRLGRLRRGRVARARGQPPPGRAGHPARRDPHPARGAITAPTVRQRRPVPVRLGRPGPGRGHRPLPVRSGRAAAGAPARPVAVARRAGPTAWAPSLPSRLHPDQPAAGADHLPPGRGGLLHGGQRAGPAGGRASLPIQAAARCARSPRASCWCAGCGRLGRDPRLAVLWAWCPVIALQAGNGAHVDVLAAFLTVAALLTLARPGGLTARRALAGGALLGLAIATKVTPVLAVPAVLRRRPVDAWPPRSRAPPSRSTCRTWRRSAPR